MYEPSIDLIKAAPWATSPPWDNRGLRDRLAGRSNPGSTVVTQLRIAMDERAARGARPDDRGRHGRHRAAR